MYAISLYASEREAEGIAQTPKLFQYGKKFARKAFEQLVLLG